MDIAESVICGDYVVTMNGTFDVIRNGAVAVGGNRIIDVGDAGSVLRKYPAATVRAGEGRALLPGLVNTHTHAAMVLFRGLADDLPLKEWLERHIWPAENRWLGGEFVSDAVALACLEMLKAGVTTYNDMYFFGDRTAEITRSMGMRAVLGVGILDFPSVAAETQDQYFANAERFIERWKDDEYIAPCIAPHASYTCGPDTLRRARNLADRLSVPLHIHLSETAWEVEEILRRYGRRPVDHLDQIGFLGPDVVAVHCVHVSHDEIGTLASRGVGVSHCIESNLKLASGIAPVPAMIRAGIRVGFGTDGAASNNDLNILGELSTAAKVHKAVAGDPTALDAKTALLMATRWGAEILGMGETTGSIEKGKCADIISVNLQRPHMTPLYDICSHLAYSAMASDVDMVVIGGKTVVEGGAVVAGSEEEIMSRASAWGRKIAVFNTK